MRGTNIAAEGATLTKSSATELFAIGGLQYMDATEVLKKDHEAVRQLFAEFESAESDDSKLDTYEDLRQQLISTRALRRKSFIRPSEKRITIKLKNRSKKH